MLAGGVLAGGVLVGGVLAAGGLGGEARTGGCGKQLQRPPAGGSRPRATDDTTPLGAPDPSTPGGADARRPRRPAIGFCAADAGRAKITVRIKPSMKVTARPPQAYKHARSVQAPTVDSPTLERMGTFPSTAGKPRQALRTSQ